MILGVFFTGFVQATLLHFQLSAAVRHVDGQDLWHHRPGPLFGQARLLRTRSRSRRAARAADPPPVDGHQGSVSFLFSFPIRFAQSNAALLGFTEFYWVEQGFTVFYRVLLGFTGLYWVLLGFTRFYWVLLGFTWLYWVLLGLTRFYWVLLGFT